VGAQEGPPNDFYAGAIALFAVIVFAKFIAHDRRARQSGGWGSPRWEVAHFLCVLLSAVGVVASLWVLGFDDIPGLSECLTRHGVFVVAILAMLILALDVWLPRSGSSGNRSSSGQQV
jgi:uncharacterized membrane protein YhhN